MNNIYRMSFINSMEKMEYTVIVSERYHVYYLFLMEVLVSQGKEFSDVFFDMTSRSDVIAVRSVLVKVFQLGVFFISQKDLNEGIYKNMKIKKSKRKYETNISETIHITTNKAIGQWLSAKYCLLFYGWAPGFCTHFVRDVVLSTMN